MNSTSDLRIDCGSRDTLIGFAGGDERCRSELVDESGNRRSDTGSLQVLGPHFQPVDESLRWDLQDLVNQEDIAVVADPATLLLDELVKVQTSPGLKGVLRLSNQDTLLLPIGLECLELLGTPVIRSKEDHPSRRSATLMAWREKQGTFIQLWIPVQKRRFVRATRCYEDAPLNFFRDTPLFVVWPDFYSTTWKDYFFFQSFSEGGLRFEPVARGGGDSVVKHSRSRKGLPTAIWSRSENPVEILAALDPSSPERNFGLILGPFVEPLDSPKKEWQLSVDLGSTHTRMFYRENNSRLPLEIYPRARKLTGEGMLEQDFFAVSGAESADLEIQSIEELPTQIVMANEPRTGDAVSGLSKNWLPYDGLAVLGRIGQDFHYDSATASFFTEIKWSSIDGQRDRARIFLSHLLLLAKAEAFHKNARVDSVGHSYPSAFPPQLANRFQLRWKKLLESEGLIDNGSEVEALAVANYLVDRQGASPAAQMLAIDIGGSTSDIAIWQNGQPSNLDSVRFAASAISTFWCLEGNWNIYCDLLKKRNCSVYTTGSVSSRLGMAGLSPSDRLPYFYVSLELLKEENRLDELIEMIRESDDRSRFLGHVSFIYGALVYYLGILSRKLIVQDDSQSKFKIYFCGKGSAFLSWIKEDDEWDTLVEVFKAAIQNPSVVEVEFHLNPEPKWEVGYGRIVPASPVVMRQVESRRNRRNPWPVCVGEQGYEGFDAVDSLDLEGLERLVDLGESAVPKEFFELNNFLSAWSSSYYRTSTSAELPSGFRETLLQRLLGGVEGSWGYEIKSKDRREEMTLDPLFLLECKVFCEMASGVPASIWQGLVRD